MKNSRTSSAAIVLPSISSGEKHLKLSASTKNLDLKALKERKQPNSRSLRQLQGKDTLAKVKSLKSFKLHINNKDEVNELVIDNNNLQKLLKATQLKLMSVHSEQQREWCHCEVLRHSPQAFIPEKARHLPTHSR